MFEKTFEKHLLMRAKICLRESYAHSISKICHECFPVIYKLNCKTKSIFAEQEVGFSIKVAVGSELRVQSARLKIFRVHTMRIDQYIQGNQQKVEFLHIQCQKFSWILRGFPKLRFSQIIKV